jgi:MurNAc alpha-1-phosphate uridylyltransferase
MSVRRAIVLAAGRGERMRPLTLTTPKPLLPAGGKPLIVWHIEKLVAHGVTELAINLSWLAARLRAALGDGRALGVRIEWFDEGPEPLDVAGGIRNALEFFAGEPFAAVNGDIWTDYTLPPPEPAGGRLAHLVLVPNPPEHPNGDFGLECGEARITGAQRFTFTGIACYRPELFAALEPGRAQLRPLLESAMHAGRVSAELFRGTWTDVGTPDRYSALQQALLSQPR